MSFIFGFICAGVIFGIGWWMTARRRVEFSKYVSTVASEVASGAYFARILENKGHAEERMSKSVNHMIDVIERQVDQISEERDLLDHILQTMTTGVVYIASDGRIEMINEAAVRMFRKPKVQCEGQEHWIVFRNYGLGAAIDNALLFGRPWRNELKVREDLTLDLRLVTLQMGHPNRGANRQSYNVLLLCNDVSQWRRLERMRSDFVANVSHELKTPVTSIQGFAETLLDGEMDGEARKAFLQVIYDESVRMGNLVADLLALSKLEVSGDEMDLKSVELQSVIDSSLKRLERQIVQHNLQVDLKSCEGVTVWADGDKLLQVFLNLLSNAIHYTSPPGTISVWCEELVDRVKIHVQDTGIGIDAEHQARVFERFYRVDRDRSRSTGGTGLGLAIVKHIVTVHGGEVGVNSRLNEGSDFWFTLSKLEPGIQGQLD